MTTAPTQRTALFTAATGYIGGRLVPELLRAGFAVRCLARHPAKLRDQPWFADVQVVEGDAGDAAAVERAARGVDVAYYLVHSLASGPRFERRDRDMARVFGRGVRRAGAGRVVYLGGLYPDGVDRDAALPHRAAAGHDHAALGRQPGAAHRRARRPPVPGRGGGPAAGRQPRLRHGRARRPDLPRHDAALRPRVRPA